MRDEHVREARRGAEPRDRRDSGLLDRAPLRVARLGDQVRVVHPGLDGQLDDLVEEGEAGAVHEDVGPAQELERALPVGQVELGGPGPPAGGLGEGFGLDAVQIGDDQLGDVGTGGEVGADRRSHRSRSAEYDDLHGADAEDTPFQGSPGAQRIPG